MSPVMSWPLADAVQSVGDFTGEGADGKVSGRIVELANDPDGYQYETVICYDGIISVNATS